MNYIIIKHTCMFSIVVYVNMKKSTISVHFVARKDIKDFKNTEKSFTSVVATAQQTIKHTKIKEFILEKIATLKLYVKRQDEI